MLMMLCLCVCVLESCYVGVTSVGVSFIWKTNVGKAGRSCNENLYQENKTSSMITLQQTFMEIELFIQGNEDLYLFLNINVALSSWQFVWMVRCYRASHSLNVSLHKFLLLGLLNLNTTICRQSETQTKYCKHCKDISEQRKTIQHTPLYCSVPFQ